MRPRCRQRFTQEIFWDVPFTRLNIVWKIENDFTRSINTSGVKNFQRVGKKLVMESE